MIALIVYIPFYFITVSKNGVEVGETTVLGTVMSWILLAHLLVYLVLSFRCLLSHSKAIKNSFSSVERINLNWLKFFLSGFVLLWIVALYLDVAESGSQSINLMWLLVSFFMYVIGYTGLWQPDIFAGSEFKEDKSAAKRYEKSTLTEENAKKYLDQLSQFMEAEKPFLDTGISLYGLAKKLSMPPHHLSQVINEKLGLNFFEFINRYRVEEAKMRLIDPQHAHLTIAAIGLDSGFNSISAFNSAFKKNAGMSPSQFRSSPRQ
jgi:AraC-like DNA-binding protein